MTHKSRDDDRGGSAVRCGFKFAGEAHLKHSPANCSVTTFQSLDRFAASGPGKPASAWEHELPDKSSANLLSCKSTALIQLAACGAREHKARVLSSGATKLLETCAADRELR